jgi:hypothetical protein
MAKAKAPSIGAAYDKATTPGKGTYENVFADSARHKMVSKKFGLDSKVTRQDRAKLDAEQRSFRTRGKINPPPSK